jgi:hypothetical protein
MGKFPLRLTQTVSKKMHLAMFPQPNPVRPLIAQLQSLIIVAHTKAIALLASRQSSPPPDLYEECLTATRDILVKLTQIDREIGVWWKEPRKVELRANLKRKIELGVEIEESRKKLNDLAVIDGRARNAAAEM